MWLGLPQTSKMKSFATIVSSFQPFTVVARFSILDVCVENNKHFNILWLLSYMLKSSMMKVPTK